MSDNNVPEDLLDDIMRRYWGSVWKPVPEGYTPLKDRLVYYLSYLRVDDSKLLLGEGLSEYLQDEGKRKIARLRAVIGLEKVLDELIHYLELLKAKPEDILGVENCKNIISIVALSDEHERLKVLRDMGGFILAELRNRATMDVILKKCEKILEMVEFKYLSGRRRSKRRKTGEDTSHSKEGTARVQGNSSPKSDLP